MDTVYLLNLEGARAVHEKLFNFIEMAHTASWSAVTCQAEGRFWEPQETEKGAKIKILSIGWHFCHQKCSPGGVLKNILKIFGKWIGK